MPQQQISYDIDDNKSVDQNLTVFAEALKEFDEPLVSVLASHFGAMSNGEHSDNAELLNALYAKTAPEPSEAAPSNADGASAATAGEQ